MPPRDIDAELKEIYLAISKVELQSKKQDLTEKSSWGAMFRNPVVVSAIITANVCYG